MGPKDRETRSKPVESKLASMSYCSTVMLSVSVINTGCSLAHLTLSLSFSRSASFLSGSSLALALSLSFCFSTLSFSALSFSRFSFLLSHLLARSRALSFCRSLLSLSLFRTIMISLCLVAPLTSKYPQPMKAPAVACRMMRIGPIDLK